MNHASYRQRGDRCCNRGSPSSRVTSGSDWDKTQEGDGNLSTFMILMMFLHENVLNIQTEPPWAMTLTVILEIKKDGNDILRLPVKHDVAVDKLCSTVNEMIGKMKNT